MAVEIKIPSVGESITEVEISHWRKQPGDWVQKDETVVVLESEKATMEWPAPVSGRLTQTLNQEGETVPVGAVIGYIEPASLEPASQPPGDAQPPPPTPEPAPAAPPRTMPAAHPAMAEPGAASDAIESIESIGPGRRVLKEDALCEVEPSAPPAADATGRAAPLPEPGEVESPRPGGFPSAPPGSQEEIVPMSRLRRTVAERLVEAQRQAALLTTFNEIDMSAVVRLRKEFGEAFLQKYQTKLGFMSFFVKAAVDALKSIPQVNAEIRGTNIVFKNYYDIGVAIGGGKGLVVPVLRSADRLSFAELEMAIADFARRAEENKLKIEELQGGTFTISNGGIYGSLLSTPIINPPQSGILGLHAIQDRPVARDGAVVIRPMMYAALTYDHRLVDGREAVTFLRRIKEVIENPDRLLLEI